MHYETIETYDDLTGNPMVGLRSTDGTIIKIPMLHAAKLFGKTTIKTGETYKLTIEKD